MIRHRQIKYPVMNSAGMATTYEQLKLLESGTHPLLETPGALVTKTCTLKPRSKIPGRTIEFRNNYTINHVGLANPGIDYYLQILDDFHIPIMISSISDIELINYICCLRSTVSIAIEVNVSCPNTRAVDIKKALKNITDRRWPIEIGFKLPYQFHPISPKQLHWLRRSAE